MISVDVWIDVVSPWCYTMKHTLEEAVAAHRSPAEVTVVYRAFEVGEREAGGQGAPGRSFDALRLVALGLEQGGPPLQGAVLERLFHAHFGGEADLTDHEQLQRLGAEAGLDESRLAELLAGDAFADAVRADEAEARDRGVESVPYVLADDAGAVHGIQPVEVVSELLARAGSSPGAAR